MSHIMHHDQSPPLDTRPPPRKRRRVVISCFECHRRKQKCDRQLPCGNCVARNKEQSCSYEAGAPTAQRRSSKSLSASDYGSTTQLEPSGCRAAETPPSRSDPSMASMAAALGYSQTGSSTMQLLECIETAPLENDGQKGANKGSPLPASPSQDSASMREKYKSLVRQLPSKMYIDQLVDMFFADVNWQYFFIDKDIFFAQLDEWNRLPFTALSSPDGGPHTLSPEFRAFPAVLFQILAVALLLVSTEEDPVFEALKYAGGMTFEDLAIDYSNSGSSILNLFGKKHLSIATLQAQFLRAQFLKYTANVTECWHAISVAIRDAQELGLHLDSMDPKPRDGTVESALENQWLIQRRRKMYMVLMAWDINMSVFLGRPGSIVWRQGQPTLPVDAPLPVEPSKTPVAARNEERDPPTLVTRILWMFQLAGPLYDMLDLQRDGCHPKDYSKVDKLHQKILDLEDSKPAVFRLENPDTRWDNYPGMHWLEFSRLYFKQLHYFSQVALHRRYMFHRKQSRTAALKASINMLDIQKRSFQGLDPASWRNFNLFFGSFDAMVMIASIYILFPHEHPELRDHAVQHFYWTIERFDAMKKRNILARSAQSVLAAIQSRFNRAVGRQSSSSGTATREPSLADERSLSASTPASSRNSIAGESSMAAPPPVGMNSSATSSTPGATGQWALDWSVPSPDNLASLAPMYPTVDLVFNDLMVKQPGEDGPLMQGDDALASLQFGGDFGSDNSFWQFLNQYQPGVLG